MNRPKVILVATDFSSPAVTAVESAIDYASCFDAKLHIAHAFTLPVELFTPYDIVVPRDHAEEAREGRELGGI